MPPTQTFKFAQNLLLRRGARVLPGAPLVTLRDARTNERVAVPQPTELDGVCAALACRYVQCRLQGTSLENLRGLPPFELKSENETQAMKIGNVVAKNASSLDGVARHFGLHGGSRFVRDSLTKVQGHLEGLQAGEGLVFSFVVEGRGGHACGAYHSRGKFGLGHIGTRFFLFDPNYGEFTSTPTELASFVASKYPNSNLTQTFVAHR